MKLRKLMTGVVVASFALGTAAPLFADDGHEHSKKKRFEESQVRHDVMEHFNDGFGKIKKIFKKEAGSIADFPAIAADMADAATKTKAAFLKDTRGMKGHTEAKDIIWDNWDDFAQRLDQLETDAAAFSEAAKTGDMALFQAAMGKVGKNCKSCHDKYKDK
ncbi:MAG: cytochrome c [Kordiimonadaceae bacterium]|nr:cytochrome c [Kordiimonadaceae bacterium]